MVKVYLGIGANIGSPVENINNAILLLSEKIIGITTAPMFKSRAVGFEDQPDFINTAIVGDTSLNILELFDFTTSVEAKIGRRKTFHWGPREIDIDIIFYGTNSYKEPTITIPHASYKERDFVLLPLLKLNPKIEDPITNQPLSEILATISNENLSIIEEL